MPNYYRATTFSGEDIDRAAAFVHRRVAPSFDESTTYDTNDVVIYNGLLYQYISTESSSGVWDSTKWEVKKLFDNDGYVIFESLDISNPD